MLRIAAGAGAVLLVAFVVLIVVAIWDSRDYLEYDVGEDPPATQLLPRVREHFAALPARLRPAGRLTDCELIMRDGFNTRFYDCKFIALHARKTTWSCIYVQYDKSIGPFVISDEPDLCN